MVVGTVDGAIVEVSVANTVDGALKLAGNTVDGAIVVVVVLSTVNAFDGAIVVVLSVVLSVVNTVDGALILVVNTVGEGPGETLALASFGDAFSALVDLVVERKIMEDNLETQTQKL